MLRGSVRENLFTIGDSVGVLDKAKRVGERESFVRCLLYGKPGAGKTVLAARFPKPVIIDVENGTSSLDNHEDLKGLTILPASSKEEMQEIYGWLRGSEEADQFDTVVIDTISELQQKLMAEQIKKEKNRDSYVPTLLDYKNNTAMMQRLLIEFRDLPKNLVLTAHEVFDKDDNEGFMYVRPDVTPRLAQTVVGLLDVIGRLERPGSDAGPDKAGKYFLQVHPSKRVIAKTRIGGLDEVIENPEPSMFFKPRLVSNSAAVTL